MPACRFIRKADWNTRAMPFVSSVSESFMNDCIRRTAVVVFPNDNNAGDLRVPAHNLLMDSFLPILHYTLGGAGDCNNTKAGVQAVESTT